MQKAIRINESHLLSLATKARIENALCGYLFKRSGGGGGGDAMGSGGGGKWQQRWFAIFHNLLFYYESCSCPKLAGVVLLESCYCERVVTPSCAGSGSSKGKENDKQYVFAISYRKDGPRQYEFRAETEAECTLWIEAILHASKVLEQKQQLEQKHLHLLQILESERQAKWHYVQQTEELTSEVKKLKNEIREYKTGRRASKDSTVETEEIKKIKKVQSFFRGWLCRRRWKQIVELYIRSEHADSMRKRNSIVFGLVECEEEYVNQLSTLVSVFLRPFRMAASSKNPPITHEDVNSIFLNSETLLFLHQIFYKGLVARMENWPTLVLDLFDMLLPMLGIYQEYVRNHHYSLQVLAEYKQKAEFNQLLRRYEEKPVCEGHQLPTFLTYPMHQLPRYIITIHELLAHTPHDHVERKSLEFALSKLEEMSQIMQDEVSETENIRKNLAIERMIIEGCDILLDVNQTFVRQGTLIQVTTDKGRSGLSRLGSFSSSFKESRKETLRQVFLFTNHLLLTTRTSNGRLHLAKHYGKIPLIECSLLEDTYADLINFDDDSASSSYDSSLSLASQNSSASTGGGGGGLLTATQPPAATANERDVTRLVDYNGADFRIMMDSRSGPPVTITLVASTVQEKAAWCSDISQCIENLHYSDIVNCSLGESSSVTMPQSIRSDPRLFRDDTDIKLSKSLNSCKVPQIRHASVDRLLDRLIDLRFMSIDFLNTFLLTYRVFTTGHTVMEALRKVYRYPEYGNLDSSQTLPFCMSSSGSVFVNRQTSDVEDMSSSPPLPLQLTSGSHVGSHVEFNRQSSDSRHLMRPHAERGRRLSVGNTRSSSGTTEISGEKTALIPRLGDSLSGHQSGFRKYERDENSDSAWSSVSTFHQPAHETSPAIQQVLTSQPASQPTATPVSTGHHNTTLLPLPTRPKLAPIASFETLSESFDHSTGPGSSGDSSDSSSPIPSSDDGVCGYTTTTALITITTSSSDSAFSSVTSPLSRCGGHSHSSSPPSMIHSGHVTTSIIFTDVADDDDDDALDADDVCRSRDDSGVSGSGCSFRNLMIPTNLVPGSSSSETLTSSFSSSHFLSTATSSDTLVPSSPRSIPTSPQCGGSGGGCGGTGSGGTSPKRSLVSSLWVGFRGRKASAPQIRTTSSNQLDALALSPATSPKFGRAPSPVRRATSPCTLSLSRATSPAGGVGGHRATSPSPIRSPASSPRRAPSPISYSYSSPNIITIKSRSGKHANADQDPSVSSFSPRSSFTTTTLEGSTSTAKAGIVVTSSRASRRRSSSTAATAAFAAATAGTANPKDHPKGIGRFSSATGVEELKSVNSYYKKRESIVGTAAAMRVLCVLRHWVSKHSQDFDSDPELKNGVKDLLEEMINSSTLEENELNIATGIMGALTAKDEYIATKSSVNIELLLTPPEVPTKDTFDTLNAIDIAEQMTYLDNRIFMSINSEELLCQAWMKPDKATRAPHVLLVSTRFNEASRLVISEIVRRTSMQDRVTCIEKWAAIADICRCMNNFNGVLQICAAFVSSSVYRLRKTWEKVSKPTKQTIDRLQHLVSSDGRFKNMRDALHRCNPPCIPYLGMYLTDLSFIEEGTPNMTDDGLINFSKMRMIAHVIREIQIFQQMAYKIDHHSRITDYLLDPSRVLEEEQTFVYSLDIEPRSMRTSVSGQS